MTECAKSAMILDGEISDYFYILQGVAQGCTLSPTLFNTFFNGLIVATESSQQGVKVGDDMVSGLMFADDIVGISGTADRTKGTNRESARIHQEMESDSER